jgi:hypothetical protein
MELLLHISQVVLEVISLEPSWRRCVYPILGYGTIFAFSRTASNEGVGSGFGIRLEDNRGVDRVSNLVIIHASE